MREHTEQRYIQYLQELCNGKCVKQIAGKFDTTESTIRQFLMLLRNKHKAKSTAHLIAILYRQNKLR